MSAHRGWTKRLESLSPGEHAAILTGTTATGIVGRLAGFELRDVLAVFLPGPATGFVFLFRKPVEASTVVAQVMATGTGALNVAACRVGLSGGTKRSGQAQHLLNDNGTEDRSHHWARTGHTVVELATGRWPPNVLFVHSPECRQIGERKIKGDPRTAKGLVPERGPGGFVNVGSRTSTGTGKPGARVYGDVEGTETVAEWECAEMCPVPALDTLSGDRPSTLAGRGDPTLLHEHPSNAETDSWFTRGVAKGSAVYADEGGASRYYPQFENLDALVAWLSVLIGDEKCHPSG